MKYAISAGHNPDGKNACGAVGLLNESTEARRVKDEVIRLLQAEGYIAKDCTVYDGTSASDVINKIVKKHKEASADVNISIHFNALDGAKPADGKIKGSEAYTASSAQYNINYIADGICNKLGRLGFTNRGVKNGNHLAFIKSFMATGILIEVCFVDDADDVRLYSNTGVQNVAKAITEGILGRSITIATPVAKITTTKPENTTCVELHILKAGSTGSEVKTLQTVLNAYGYKGADGKQLKADGDFGNNTKFAVVLFQQDEKLSKDGIVGKATWEKLLK
jgi:N-acetylmuramoyl-L-alanine amidase